MSETSVVPEPCTSWSRRKRHFSVDLRPVRVGGRNGTTLCGADAYDEENRNAWMASFGSSKRVTVAELPPCKKCERVRVSAERSDPSKSS